MNINQVGKKVIVEFDCTAETRKSKRAVLYRNTQKEVMVVIGIKAPRGQMFLFESDKENDDAKTRAIEAFMEFCRND